ncbi:MAG: hypothetical protein ABH840_03025 [Nanoarchaeota archaeon]
MALEDLIGQDELKSIVGKPFGISPDSKYDRKDFVTKASDLFDLEEYHGKLTKNSGDVSALNDTTGLLYSYIEGDDEYKKEWIEQAKENPHLALSRSDKCLSVGYVNMAKFVENNRKSLLDKLSAKQLYGIFSRVQLYKTGEKEHDRAVDLRMKMMQMQQASQEGGNINEVISKELSELVNSMPPEHQAYLFENEHLVLPSIGRVIIRAIQKKFSSLFKDEKGNLDKAQLIKYLEKNYKVVEDDIKGIPSENEKERYKRWDKNLKPQYIEIARELLSPEKSEQKEKDDQEGEKRKKKAKRKGLST